MKYILSKNDINVHSVHPVFLTLSCRRTMGVRCLIVVVHRSHQASASPIHPTRSSHLPLISRSPKHNNKCRSNHNSKDSLLLGEFVSSSHAYLSEWNIGLIYICGLIGSTDCYRLCKLNFDKPKHTYTKLHYAFF